MEKRRIRILRRRYFKRRQVRRRRKRGNTCARMFCMRAQQRKGVVDTEGDVLDAGRRTFRAPVREVSLWRMPSVKVITEALQGQSSALCSEHEERPY